MSHRQCIASGAAGRLTRGARATVVLGPGIRPGHMPERVIGRVRIDAIATANGGTCALVFDHTIGEGSYELLGNPLGWCGNVVH